VALGAAFFVVDFARFRNVAAADRNSASVKAEIVAV